MFRAKTVHVGEKSKNSRPLLARIAGMALLTGAVIGLATPAVAEVVTNSNYLYTLYLPAISGGVEQTGGYTEYQFDWVGALMYNAAPNTACPTICGPVSAGETVKAGYYFDGFSFTSNGISDSEVIIKFADGGGNTITFNFIEPDSFWAAFGTQTFASNSQSPPDGVGASFSIGGTDPGCDACKLGAQLEAPEPGTPILAAAMLMGLALLLVGKRCHRRPVHENAQSS